mgnify:CR=1 FL=1
MYDTPDARTLGGGGGVDRVGQSTSKKSFQNMFIDYLDFSCWEKKFTKCGRVKSVNNRNR